MVAGALTPRNVRYLIGRLDQGYSQGLMRQRGGAILSRSPIAPFKPFPNRARRSVLLAGRVWERARVRQEACNRVVAGDIVTVFLFSPSALYHKVRFTPDGFWEQTGGLFGRSDRHAPLFRVFSFSERVNMEKRRLAGQRLLG